MTAEQKAQEYKAQFGFQLKTRLAVLSHRYPNVKEPSWISWEGEPLTGADTTDKIRALLKETPYV